MDHRNLLRGCSEDQHGVKAKYQITGCSKKTYLENLLQRQEWFQEKLRIEKFLQAFLQLILSIQEYLSLCLLWYSRLNKNYIHIAHSLLLCVISYSKYILSGFERAEKVWALCPCIPTICHEMLSSCVSALTETRVKMIQSKEQI